MKLWKLVILMSYLKKWLLMKKIRSQIILWVTLSFQLIINNNF